MDKGRPGYNDRGSDLSGGGSLTAYFGIVRKLSSWSEQSDTTVHHLVSLIHAFPARPERYIEPSGSLLADRRPTGRKRYIGDRRVDDLAR